MLINEGVSSFAEGLQRLSTSLTLLVNCLFFSLDMSQFDCLNDPVVNSALTRHGTRKELQSNQASVFWLHIETLFVVQTPIKLRKSL